MTAGRDHVMDRVDSLLGRGFYHAHPDLCPDWDEPVEREDNRYEDEEANGDA